MSQRLNFAVGPVMMDEEVRAVGGAQIPYFRTGDFSAVMKENECLMREFALAEEGSRVIALTASGTAGMEMAVVNYFDHTDKVLVVNGGSFGERFVTMCALHGIPYESIALHPGEALTQAHLDQFENAGFTGFLVNMDETSTGVLYDMAMIGDFCRRNHLFLIVDAISSFMADDVRMAECGIDVLIVSSQKALALPPGMSFLILNRRAVKLAMNKEIPILYFRIADYLKDGERGQTPYTPAVSILLQLNARLKKIKQIGREREIGRVHHLAQYFRERICKLPFHMLTSAPSNAVTALVPEGERGASYFYKELDERYNIWVCPNGGDLKEKVFRVGHIGDLCDQDYDRLLKAMHEIVNA